MHGATLKMENNIYGDRQTDTDGVNSAHNHNSGTTAAWGGGGVSFQNSFFWVTELRKVARIHAPVTSE